MLITCKHSGKFFQKTTATGLVSLLLLGGLPGCVARHNPDWSKVQGVKPDTQTEVQLYKDEAPRESRKIKGRFLSATGDSVTLKLKDGQVETFQRNKVRKVLARVPVVERWPGWVALGTPIALVKATASTRGRAIDGTPVFYSLLFLPAIPFFLIPWMRKIYEIPPEHRDWYPQGTSSATVAPSDGQGSPPPTDNHNEAVTKSR